MSAHGHTMTTMEHLLSKKWHFLVAYLLIFFLSVTTLRVFGVGPRAPISSQLPGAPIATSTQQGIVLPAGQGELPVRVEIPSINLAANINNPSSTNVSALDQALLTGAVRYPGSGVPGENGNVLLFGHSSHLPVVHNQAFRAFNDIQNLKAGEPIYLLGTDKVYVYAVEKVEKANTTTGEISLAADGAKLTMATCDNFGSKSDRFIVTAHLVNVQDLPESQ